MRRVNSVARPFGKAGVLLFERALPHARGAVSIIAVTEHSERPHEFMQRIGVDPLRLVQPLQCELGGCSVVEKEDPHPVTRHGVVLFAE